jgi:DnaJ-class molecular chaperone
MEHPVACDEAVLGAKVDVPTIRGPVARTIPPGASLGWRLRLQGKGVRRAGKAVDQVGRLAIARPKGVADGMRALAERRRQAGGFDPRAEPRRRICARTSARSSRGSSA